MPREPRLALAIVRELPATLQRLRREAGYTSLRQATEAARRKLADYPLLRDALPQPNTLSRWELNGPNGLPANQPSLVSLIAYLAALGHRLGDLELAALESMVDVPPPPDDSEPAEERRPDRQ